MKRNIAILIFCICSVLFSFQSSAQTKIIKGGSPYGDVLYNFDGTSLRSGTNQYSTALFNWDGEAIRKGSSKYSEKLLTISGKLPVGLLIFILM